MKVNYLIAILFVTFVSIVVIANIDDITLIGGTELNGNGCVCHRTERDTSVHVWVEGPDTLLVGQTGYYKMFMTGGPAEAGGYNVAGRFGEMVLVDSFSVKHPLAPNELTQAFTLPFPMYLSELYGSVCFLIRVFISLGVNVLSFNNIKAATPATIGVAYEVPDQNIPPS